MEGRTHEVRELFFRAGHPVQRLRRTAIGPLRDDTLKPGEYRTISSDECDAMRRATSKSAHRATSRTSRRQRSKTSPGRSKAKR
jgi:23S rRNA pseudouridine2605 synthase